MSNAGGATLASTLTGSSASIISADVALDASDPIVGSFAVDGLTYAVGPDGLALVAADASAVSDGAIAVPASVTYNGVAYDVVAVGPYAFYLSAATSVELPASIVSVDGRAFRSSDVGRVEVAAGNPNIASYDGALYSADKSSLLLIPEGRAGAVLLPCEAEVAEPSLFSHCSLVDAISVGEGGAAFASWEGLLYDASGTTLLRVPAGAIDITIRDGCAAIAAGAMEGCAKLERITAPASVTSISPDLFESVPTISLPIASALQADSVAGPLAGPGYEGDARSASADPPAEGRSDDSTGAEGEAEASPRRVVASSQGLEVPDVLPDLGSASASPSSEASGSAPQLTAMVALSTTDDDLLEVDPSSIEVALPEGADIASWQAAGFAAELAGTSSALASSLAKLQDGAPYSANATVHLDANGGAFTVTRCRNFSIVDGVEHGDWETVAGSAPEWNVVYDSDGDTEFGCHVDFGAGWWIWENGVEVLYRSVCSGRVGYTLTGIGGSVDLKVPVYSHSFSAGSTYTLLWRPNTYTISLDAQGGSVSQPSIDAAYDQDATLPAPVRTGYRFLGWNTAADGSGTTYQPGVVRNLTDQDGAIVTLYAQWKICEISFDTDSEPDDADYPGVGKDPISADTAGPDGTIQIEDPKRPGYVFEGWVIPSGGGTEAVDQDLVYQGSDGKWYVDASKLPGYAGDDGRVELTARWTSVISVDVPSSVTFYADLVTQGQESREGAASSAFGQSKVSNQSQVDLRVVGLESSAVKTTDTILGADSVLKKADAATPSSSTQKLLSLYPSTKQWTADELQDPDAVGGDKAASAVDFDLDDILLEKSFKADDFTIAAGDTLNMGYRLNLTESGQQLDYDKLATLSEGQSASIANVSYCFAADALPSDWDEPLWVENPNRTSNPAKYLLLDDIKQAADDLSANGTASEYYATYKGLLDAQVTDNGTPGAGPYFQLKVDGIYLPLQLIGICQDTKSDGTGKAGLTFQMKDVYAYDTNGSNGTFDCRMNPADTNSGGWGSSSLRSILRTTFWGYLPADVQSAIVGVNKYQQLPGGADASKLQKTTGETIWLPSTYEVFGTSFANYNDSESLAANGNAPFQYMAYQGNDDDPTANPMSVKDSHWWLRSAYQRGSDAFCNVYTLGRGSLNAGYSGGVAPAFCL